MGRACMEQLLESARDHAHMSRSMATSDDELERLLSRDLCWMEGMAAGMHEAGGLTDEELDEAPSLIQRAMGIVVKQTC